MLKNNGIFAKIGIMNNEQLSIKQKQFADSYLDNGKNASAAYRATYGNDNPEANINSMASRLLRSVKVQDYIVKVQRKNLEKTVQKQDIDRSFLIGQYLELVEMGKAKGQISAAIRALDSLAHITGLWLSKVEVKGSVDHNLTQLDTTQLLDALQQAKQPKAIEADYREVDGDVV